VGRVISGALLFVALAPSAYAQAPEERNPSTHDSIRIWSEDLGGGWREGRIARAVVQGRPLCTGIEVEYPATATGQVIVFYRDIDSLQVRPRSMPLQAAPAEGEVHEDATWVALDPKRLAAREPGCTDAAEGPA
jgi:hypothetical protein